MAKSADSAYTETLLRKRVAVAKQIRQNLQTNESVAQRSVELYSKILDEIIRDIAAEVHREAKTGGVESSRPDKRAREYKIPQAPPKKGVMDVFGNLDAVGLSEEVTCNSCGRRVAASRFAPHLEKCMGKGRNASRAKYSQQL